MTGNDQPGTDLAPKISQELLAVFAAMAAGIPETDDSEAYDSILTTILAAETVDQLNDPWDTEQIEKLAGHQLRVDELFRRPSDFAGGLGMYLVAKGVDQATGERFTLTTGSIAITAQLARGYYLGGLPMLIVPVVGDPSPRTGRRPQHLQIVGLAKARRKPAAGTAAAAAGTAAADEAPF